MSTKLLDFQEIKANNPVEKVAERLGLELKKAGHQFRGPCFSGEGGDRALVITPAKGLWYSFGLGRGGDVIKLVAEMQECSPKDAAAWIAGDTVPEKKAVKSSSKGGGKPSEGFSPLEYLEPGHEAVEAVGFTVEDAERLGVGFAPRGMLKGHVAIPIRTSDGTLAGYIGVIEAVLPPSWKA